MIADDPDDVVVARIALLSIRGRLAQREHGLTTDRVLLAGSPVPLSPDAASRALARLPKPVRGNAEVRDGMMVVSAEPITDPRELASIDWMRSAMSTDRGMHGQRRLALGDQYDRSLVYCAGFGESLVVTVAQWERSFRDYQLDILGGSNASPPSHYLGTNAEAARAAYAARAVFMAKYFFGADDWAPERAGTVIVIRDGETWDTPVVYAFEPESTRRCDQCQRVTSPTWTATDTRPAVWKEGIVCNDCLTGILAPTAVTEARELEEWIEGLSPAQQQELEEEIVSRLDDLAKPWQLLTAPAEVVATLRKHRPLE